MKTNLFIVLGVMTVGIVVGLAVLFAIDPGGDAGPSEAANDSNDSIIVAPPAKTAGGSSVPDSDATEKSIQDSSSVKDSAVLSVSESASDSPTEVPAAVISSKDGEGFGLSNSVEFVVRDKNGNIKDQGQSK